MIKNYFTIACRNLMRFKIFSMINILGLAIGMACCILVFCFIQDEWGYEQFHPKAERIYRVVREARSQDGAIRFGPFTSGGLGPALKTEFPEIEASVRLRGEGCLVDINGKSVRDYLTLVDPAFLDEFNFPLVQGNQETAFAHPQAVLITQKAAQKFFGNADPMGKDIQVTSGSLAGHYVVTGILRNLPKKTHLYLSMVTATLPASSAWWEDWRGVTAYRPVTNYVVLKKDADPDALVAKLPQLMRQKMGNEVATYNTYHLQPLLRIHLYSDSDYGFGSGYISQIKLYGSIAGFILLIASINFMNLTTARSLRRAHEVGLRKVVGARRKQLIGQFLGESILTAFLALLLGVGLAELTLPAFNHLTWQKLVLSADTYMLLLPALLGLGLFVGIMSGLYPAFVLSRFLPVEVLKGHSQVGQSGTIIRKGLVVFQFAISTFLIVSTLVVYLQTNYMQNKDPGFNENNVINLFIFSQDRIKKSKSDNFLSQHYNDVKRMFLQHPNILKATAYRYTLGNYPGQFRRVIPEGTQGAKWEIRMNEVDEDFFDTFEIPIIAGRSFSADIPSDEIQAYILNESAVKAFGWKDPIGKRFEWAGNASRPPGTIIGVVKDFHAENMRKKISPIVFIMARKELISQLSLRIRPDNVSETLTFIENTYKQFLPDQPYFYHFVNEQLDEQYDTEKRLGTSALIFTVMAILIACLGLFGLALFAAERRTKEIGIRKILGASIPNIIQLLCKSFVFLVLLANLIAWPMAYWIMTEWLQNFAYRIDVGFGLLLLSGALTLFIAIIIVSTQALKIARTNPVDALRYE